MLQRSRRPKTAERSAVCGPEPFGGVMLQRSRRPKTAESRRHAEGAQSRSAVRARFNGAAVRRRRRGAPTPERPYLAGTLQRSRRPKTAESPVERAVTARHGRRSTEPPSEDGGERLRRRSVGAPSAAKLQRSRRPKTAESCVAWPTARFFCFNGAAVRRRRRVVTQNRREIISLETGLRAPTRRPRNGVPPDEVSGGTCRVTCDKDSRIVACERSRGLVHHSGVRTRPS